jgi:hypothetical protein
LKWPGDVTIDQLLANTEKLAGTKKDKKCLIFSGSYLAQDVDYYSYLDRPDVDLIGHNLCWLLPGAEKFAYMLHGSRGYTNAYSKTCTTFNAFCKRFQGQHLFCSNSKHWAGGPYPLPSVKDTITTIQKHDIDKYFVFTQEYKNRPLSYVPPSTADYKLSRLPAGCGGTLNAITLPFVLKLGYKEIYIAGVGDQLLHHFYDGHILFAFGVVPPKKKLNHRDTSLGRYKKLAQCARASGSEIIVMPGNKTEPSIKAIFKTANKIS